MKFENPFKKNKEIPDYPSIFYLVEYSDVALENGTKDSRNKIITLYYYNKYGFLDEKRYPYSEIRIKALRGRGIAGVDKTYKETKLAVFSRVLPGEIKYKYKE